MQLRNLTMALGALGLVTTPVLAQAAVSPAARAGAPVESAEQIGGSGVLVAILALAAIAGGILIAVEDSDEPTSP